jgi:hypothetical protein
LLLALTVFGVFTLHFVLAMAASARADTVADWIQTAATARRAPGTAVRFAQLLRNPRRRDRAA